MTTRRNLLKSSLSLAAAPVGMSVAIEVAHAEDMPKWNNETDVLVLGYGNAGSNAAIAAAEAGAKVLILEKTPAGGGNVSVSSGGFVVPTNKEDYYKLALFNHLGDFGRTFQKGTSSSIEAPFRA